MLIKNVKVFTKDKSFKITDIATAGVRIAECSGDEQMLDAKGLIAIPGLIDIHFHGAMGHDFCNATLEGLYQIAGYEAENGITAICPATMNPARSIGISNDHGSIEVGKYADIVIIDNELNIVHVINKGEIIR